MLDVHPPEHTPHSWRDFFIHIATIVVGLIIAVGLEQSVEYLHHRHQVGEARRALDAERDRNRKLFGLQTSMVRYRTPCLQRNLSVLLYIREHPGAPRASWPGEFNWSYLAVPFDGGAWMTAQRDGVVELMGTAEVQELTDLYIRLDRVRAYDLAERTAVEDARAYFVRTPDPSHLTGRELDNLIDQATQILAMHERLMGEKFRVTRLHPDFTPTPTKQDFDAVTPPMTAGEQQFEATFNREFDQIQHEQ
jgi:hypothetical protein